MTSISSQANVSADAIIGENVKIEPFSIIEDDVVIGEGSWIGSHVSIMKGARIGKYCRIFSAVIAGIPQDLKFTGEYSSVEIGDYNTIRENVTINRGTKTKGKTFIGSHNLIMANSHVGHDCSIGSNCVIGYSVGIAGEAEIYDYVNISGLSGVHQFSKIGSHAIVGGLSKVNKDVPPYCMAARDPLSFTGLNTVGLKRRGFTTDMINEIRDIYRVIFQSNNNLSQAILAIQSNFPRTFIRTEILDFLNKSDRGIIKKKFKEQSLSQP